MTKSRWKNKTITPDIEYRSSYVSLFFPLELRSLDQNWLISKGGCGKLALTLLFICHLFYPMCMGGLGLCLCCKEDKLLTEHLVKEIMDPIMICGICLIVMEVFLKLI